VLSGSFPTHEQIRMSDGIHTGDSTVMMPLAPPTYYNLRASLPFVVDPAGSVGALSGEAFPTVRSGLTFGSVFGPGFAGGNRDRKADNPAQLAGTWSDSDAPGTYEELVVDLTPFGGPGVYKVGAAMGEPFAGLGGPARIRVYDDTALLLDVEVADTAANHFRDLHDNYWDVSEWLARQVPFALTFETSMLVVRLGQASATGHSKVNCVSVQRVA
jgi:hypothetical protein